MVLGQKQPVFNKIYLLPIVLFYRSDMYTFESLRTRVKNIVLNFKNFGLGPKYWGLNGWYHIFLEFGVFT